MHAVELFNYKQRQTYQIDRMELICSYDIKEFEWINFDLIAYGKPKAKTVKIFSTRIGGAKDVIMGLDFDPIPKSISSIIAQLIRYGLKQMYLEGEEISEDAYI